MRPLWAVLLAYGAAALAACSSGPEVSATFSSPDGENLGSGGAGAAAPAATSSSAGGESGASSSASSSSSSGSAGGGGAGGCDHSSPKTCFSAVELPSFPGDEDGDARTLKGTKAAWFKVLVTEGSNSSNALSYTATLISPPGVVFQLLAFNGDSSMPNCLGEALVAVGDPPTVSSTWPDNSGPDDQRWITFEVRYIAGEVCDPAPEWKLSVKGHTQ